MTNPIAILYVSFYEDRHGDWIAQAWQNRPTLQEYYELHISVPKHLVHHEPIGLVKAKLVVPDHEAGSGESNLE